MIELGRKRQPLCWWLKTNQQKEKQVCSCKALAVDLGHLLCLTADKGSDGALILNTHTS